MGPPYQPISLLSEELTRHKSFLYSFVEVESKIHVFFVVKATALSQLWLLVNRAFNSYMLSSPFLGKCKNKNEYWLALARPRPPFLQLQFNSCQNSVAKKSALFWTVTVGSMLRTWLSNVDILVLRIVG